MNVRIEIGFSFKRELPGDLEAIDLPEGADVLSALERLADRFPAFRAHVFDGGKIQRNIDVLVNGRNVVLGDGFRTRLADGDRLTILPPVGGG